MENKLANSTAKNPAELNRPQSTATKPAAWIKPEMEFLPVETVKGKVEVRSVEGISYRAVS